LRILLFFLLALNLSAHAQIHIRVVDSLQHTPIPGAVIWSDSKAIGQTDTAGVFVLPSKVKQVRISAVGYMNYTLGLLEDQTEYTVMLQENFISLSEVVVKKRKYRNKGNPAVELIRQVIAQKDENRNSGYSNLYYKEHEKVRIGLVNYRHRILKHPVVRLFPTLEENFDSLRVEGKVFLPLFVQESLNEIHRNGGNQEKRILEEKSVKLDENLFDNEGIKMYIAHAYQPFDIYDNNMMLITNQFVSPISDLAPAFYMYTLGDTTLHQGRKYIKLYFTPRNNTDFLFWGEMKIDLVTYGVTEIQMRTGKGINLNWIRNLEIDQQFFRNAENRYSLKSSNVAMQFSITTNSREALMTEKLIEFSDYNFDPSPAGEKQEVIQRGVHEQIGEGSAYDDKVYKMLDSLKETRRFKGLSALAGILGYGYFNAGKYLEVGPLSTFVGRNSLEGLRTRVGLRTMPAFSNKLFFEGYGAYGFRDERWKYNLLLTYSMTGKNKYVFPMKNFSVGYRSDIEIPGNNLRYTADYSFLLNIPRGVTDKWIYYKRFTLRYVQEFQNRFSYRLGYENTVQEPAGSLVYGRGDLLNRTLTTSELRTELRYAPNERFYQGKTNRSSLTTQFPVFTLRAAWGIKGLQGGEYDFGKVSLNIDKRFLLGPLGYTESTFEAGITLGKNLPYPLLDIMRANQTYTFQQSSYNMMNFMEFVGDRFAGVKLEHNFNGSILNKIPVLSLFKLREYLSLKALVGDLSEKNGPRYGAYAFPVNEEGQQAMYALSAKPYVEGSVGIGNILKFFRIDLVKRFTYLHHPDISGSGIRFRADFDF
jgi:hypothetical protein